MIPLIPDEGRILGIDYGTRRVGVAVSDPLRIVAQGAGTLENSPSLFQELSRLAARYNVAGIVVGMPYAPDGGPGGKGEEVLRFVEALRAAMPGIAVDTWDESYTSVDAGHVLREAGMRRGKRREKKRVDEMAARLLLQEYLEHLRHRTASRG